MKRLMDFPKYVQEQMKEVVSIMIPEGGPLDDMWPDCQMDVEMLLLDEFKEWITEEDDLYDLSNNLIDAKMRGL